MPQEFQVLQCYSCDVFQVDIFKKQPRWQCKMCHEKQSVKQIFLKGTSKDCRLMVQDYNLKRLSYKETVNINMASSETQNSDDLVHTNDPVTHTSKWSEFVTKSNKHSLDNDATTMDDFSFERATKRRRGSQECTIDSSRPYEYDVKQDPAVFGMETQRFMDSNDPANVIGNPLIVPTEANPLVQNLADCRAGLQNYPKDMVLQDSSSSDQLHFTKAPIIQKNVATRFSFSANSHSDRDEYHGHSRSNIHNVSKFVFEESGDVDFLDDFLF